METVGVSLAQRALPEEAFFEINTVFMFVCTALVQLMTPGLAFFYAGLHRPSSVCALLAMSFASMGVVMDFYLSPGGVY